MRTAVVSDIHGNLAAFEAVLADLQLTSPDLILHGGDLAHGGSRPAEVVDRLRELGWSGVLGNADEMLFDTGPLRAFASQSTVMVPLLPLIEEMADATREASGDGRLDWLRALPRRHVAHSFALVHVFRCDRLPNLTSVFPVFIFITTGKVVEGALHSGEVILSSQTIVSVS